MTDDEKTSVDIALENADLELPPRIETDEIKVGDKVVHTSLYISVCRGNAREKAKTAVYEVIKVTPRSITTREWGSDKPYGSQYERRYIKKADA